MVNVSTVVPTYPREAYSRRGCTDACVALRRFRGGPKGARRGAPRTDAVRGSIGSMPAETRSGGR